MQVRTISAQDIAGLIFRHIDEKPRIDFYLTRTEDGSFEGGCSLGVKRFADSYIAVGNYYGGGAPFLHDFSLDDDESLFADTLKAWLQTLDSDCDDDGSPVIHIDLADTSSDWFPVFTVVIRDGRVDNVYCTQQDFGVDIVDLDTTVTDEFDAAKKEAETLERDFYNGKIFKQ